MSLFDCFYQLCSLFLLNVVDLDQEEWNKHICDVCLTYYVAKRQTSLSCYKAQHKTNHTVWNNGVLMT